MINFGGDEEGKTILKLKDDISRERELIDLMKSQLSNDFPSLVGYLECKLEGLKVKSQSLSKFLISQFRSSSETPVQENDSRNQNTIACDPFDSLELNANSPTINFHEANFYEEIDDEIQKISAKLLEKDEQIAKLKETMDTCLQQKDEMITELEDEIVMLKHTVEIYKHHLKGMRGEIQRLCGEINQYEKMQDMQVLEIKELEERLKNSECEIETLFNKISESEDLTKKYEKILEEAGIDSSGSYEYEKPNKVERLKMKLDKMESEIRRLKEELKQNQYAAEERYNSLVSLYTKNISENEKQNEYISKLKNKIHNFKDKILENQAESLNQKLKLQEELMKTISTLRTEKQELKAKIRNLTSKEFSSKDLSGGNHLLSLHQEIEQVDDILEDKDDDVISIYNFQEILYQDNRMLYEHINECEQQIKMLDGIIKDLRIDLEGKELEIIRLKKECRKSNEEVKSRPSFLLKVKANPIVLELFGGKRHSNFS
ncbi:hypothetical protein SteCoe_1592 [Stentor coeruleus]|uniref:Uncharacterized protein n=1 Tax=Stentor coeruleus TaxID=5963 RepID=A0A1R2D1F9_9CILI|nr:hypothetical protein SteCoe_1592 [Stentor coeruleus]